MDPRHDGELIGAPGARPGPEAARREGPPPVWSSPEPAPRRRSRPLLALTLVGLAAAAIAFVVAPLFAFRAVRAAAEYGDVQALAELVDYPAVRQSLRVQLRPASIEKRGPADLLRDPVGTLRRAWEPVASQPDVEPLVTPEGLAALAQGRGPPQSGFRPTLGGGLFGGPVPAVRFWGSERVRLGVRDPAAPGRQTILTFERKGLYAWRLAAIRLPESAG